MSAATHVPIATGLSAVTAETDVLLVDVWGVIHNGVRAYAEAAEALIQFRQRGGTVILVSNAPRGSDIVIPFLDGMGVPRTAYDGMVTSGDVARSYLASAAKKTLYYIGPPRDRSVFAGLPIQETSVAEAELVLCTGFEDDEKETPLDYVPRLSACLTHHLTMVCANPDLVVERGHALVWCAGALAEKYEKMGGKVIWTGKPHRIIYEAALSMARNTRNADVPLSRVMAIGDAIRTDVAGARGLGVRVLMTADGIHGGALLDETRHVVPSKADAFFSEAECVPDYVIARLLP